jgi:GNAT superfamily N-acetyltransferase
MTLSPFTTADIPYLPLLQPEGWHDIVPVHRFYTAAPFCYPVKITLANEVVGVGTTIMHHDTAWLAHIIVHPEYRNKGIGKYITQSLINSIDSRLCKTIYLIATALGEPVYEKLGFETETEYLFYKDLKADKKFHPSTCILPYTQNFHEQIQLMDQRISGENRLFHFENRLATAFVYTANNRVEGYYIPDFHEGLIIAASSEAGTALMQQRLITKDHAAFPINNTAAITCMSIQGFEPFKTAKRMRLGEIREVDYSKIFNRIAGSIG